MMKRWAMTLPDLPDKPRRRSFTAEYKLAIVAEYDACVGDGDKGALVAPGGLVLQPHRGVAPGPGQRGGRPAWTGLGRPRRARTGRRWPRRSGGSSASRVIWPEAQAGVGHRGKSSRALGDACRERDRRRPEAGIGVQAEAVIEACFAELVPLLGTAGACRASGRSRATHYRRAAPPVLGPPPPRRRRDERPVSRRDRGAARRCCARPGFVTWPPPRSGPS